MNTPDAQECQSAYDKITTSSMRDQDVKVYVLARLFAEKFINSEDIKAAENIAKELNHIDEKIKAKLTADAKELAKVTQMPDSMIPKLWPMKNTQPQRLVEYSKICNLEDLETFYKDFKARPMHYNSQFPKGEIVNVLVFLENTINSRHAAQTSTSSSKQPKPSQPATEKTPEPTVKPNMEYSR